MTQETSLSGVFELKQVSRLIVGLVGPTERRVEFCVAIYKTTTCGHVSWKYILPYTPSNYGVVGFYYKTEKK